MISELEFAHRGKVWTARKHETAPGASYVECGDGWAVYAPTVGDRCELSGIACYDTAVPQEWHDEHRAEISLRGGWCVWTYPHGNLFGRPEFADTVCRLAQQTCAAEIVAALESTEGREKAS